MKILFLGDVAAAPGRKALSQFLPALRQKHALDVVIANGENAANGRGITLETANEIFAAGVDVITLGDHTFDQKGTEELLANSPKIIRPANYPSGTVGRGATTHTLSNGKKITVINLQGRVFINQQTDCPFQLSKRLMEEHILGQTCDALVIDIHAEATSEKTCLAHLWDGKATLVIGTHTHIPTADARIQPAGTAYQTDAGMCGDYQSSLGMSFASVLPNFFTRGRHAFQPATGEATLSGVIVEAGQGGLAEKIQPLRHGGVLQPTE
ncbi:MAG: TIGR00282 family metallophosphoesterase [Proteobacteria bacterium]|nr:TIGR00282 family metallophosphoesterase [Pseudomonadota bacterium]